MRQTGTIALKIRGELVEMKLSIPTGEAEPVEMLDAARTMTDAIVGAMARKAARETGPVSCRAGCDSCCYHFIGVSEAEARDLAAYVDAQPDARRATLRERFAAAAAALRDSAAATRRETGLNYLSRRIPCPFLEDGRCSVYERRPLGCREYMVTSPPANCAAPTAETVHPVPMPARVSNALIRISAPGKPVAEGFVALQHVLEWAAAHPEPPACRPGPDMLKELVESLTKS